MIYIQGDGGHAKVIRDLIDELSIAAENYHSADAWIVAVGNNAARRREAENLRDVPFAVLIHPRAFVSNAAIIGAGSVVMAGAVVQAGAIVGKHVILNTGCSVDHGCVIADYAHISPGAHLCGGVSVGQGAQVGCGVAVAQNATIPAWTLCKARRLEFEPIPSN